MPEHIHLPLQQRFEFPVASFIYQTLQCGRLTPTDYWCFVPPGLTGGYQWDWFDAYRGEALEISTIPYI